MTLRNVTKRVSRAGVLRRTESPIRGKSRRNSRRSCDAMHGVFARYCCLRDSLAAGHSGRRGTSSRRGCRKRSTAQLCEFDFQSACEAQSAAGPTGQKLIVRHKFDGREHLVKLNLSPAFSCTHIDMPAMPSAGYPSRH